MCVTSIHLIAFVSLTNRLVLLELACFRRTTVQLKLCHLEKDSKMVNRLGMSQTRQARALRTLLERRPTRESSLSDGDSDLITPIQVNLGQIKHTNIIQASHSTLPTWPWQPALNPEEHRMERLCVGWMMSGNKAMQIQIQAKCKSLSSRSHLRAIWPNWLLQSLYSALIVLPQLLPAGVIRESRVTFEEILHKGSVILKEVAAR